MKFRSLMSMILSTTALITVAACSSAPKAESPPPKPTAVVAEPTPAATPAKAEKKDASPDTLVTCTLGSDKRVIEVESDDAGCEVHYTKGDKTSTVASDKAGRGHCDKTVDKMKGKLEAAGYKCQ